MWCSKTFVGLHRFMTDSVLNGALRNGPDVFFSNETLVLREYERHMRCATEAETEAKESERTGARGPPPDSDLNVLPHPLSHDPGSALPAPPPGDSSVRRSRPRVLLPLTLLILSNGARTNALFHTRGTSSVKRHVCTLLCVCDPCGTRRARARAT